MKITLNDRPLELAQPLNLDMLLTEHFADTLGVALAVNQTIIPRQQWPTHQIQNDDDILLFQVIAGG